MTLLIPSFNAKWLPLLLKENRGKINMEPSEAYLADMTSRNDFLSSTKEGLGLWLQAQTLSCGRLPS